MTEFERYYRSIWTATRKWNWPLQGHIGYSESRRILGDYVMVLDDFINRASFDDEIGRYAYPIDIHPSDTSVEGFKKFEKEYYNLRYKDGESYGIPYRALTPRGLQNVLVAGAV